ncbi:hypothetical protein CPAR01_10137 [Colletotrichum paranaense]|uniref:Reticulocyte-binding protein 2-like protein a n=1 Tax=Colletotrichum paranaense TaxID=1914294 RepID=A0ABQ9SD53_9PEZI|nr:uncharacterized protein CPAR01_10137 [Colletotrichum paranaense]KAK1533429.1 hypothetical protein CPAR01_10137 [Colletotrichum paranaense]
MVRTLPCPPGEKRSFAVLKLDVVNWMELDEHYNQGNPRQFVLLSIRKSERSETETEKRACLAGGRVVYLAWSSQPNPTGATNFQPPASRSHPIGSKCIEEEDRLAERRKPKSSNLKVGEPEVQGTSTSAPGPPFQPKVLHLLTPRPPSTIFLGVVSGPHHQDTTLPIPNHHQGGDNSDLSTPTGQSSDLGNIVKLTDQTPPTPSNDRHEIHEITTPSAQRQQQRRQARNITPDPVAERPTTPASSQLSHRTLRRTSRSVATPSPTPQSARQVHIEAASVGFSPKPQVATAPAPAPTPTLAPAPTFNYDYPRTVAPLDRRNSRARRVLSQDLSEDFDEESSDEALLFRDPTSTSSHTRRESHRPHRVSRNTRSAILFALEEALRQPNLFTPDEIEEGASMADLIGGGTAASNGNASASTRQRTTGAPNPTSSPSGIRGPRMIMQERAAREAARQRAEQEQMQLERQRAEQEARLLEETQRRNAERRAATAATGAAGGGTAGGAANVPQQDPTSHRRPVATDTPQTRTNPGGSSRQPTTTQPQTRHGRTASTSQPGQQPYSTAPQASTTQQPANTSVQGAQESGATGSRPRNSFPHAFERWETLSAHWEGLTSFWIRRLEQNNQDIERDPVNQALSRQVTDLTAAGANLFHAVVELQRLRASSERKFQRWFFETRAELERAQEVNAMLESALDEERRARENAVQAAIQKERQHSANDERVREMKKELQISKEEARRAWEELGRREHEERERTQSLQSGQPTILGGVQVVPMTQGVPSRHGSSREQYGGQQAGYAGDYSQAPGGQSIPATSSNLYPSGDPGQEGVTYTGAGSEGGYSEGEYTIDAQGHFVRDSQGNKVPFIAPPSPVSDEGIEEYETPATNPPSAGYLQTPTTSAGEQQQGTAQDYSGSGYAAPGWETVPRHHHPTRLSDVMEEDERSRASNSQVGRH